MFRRKRGPGETQGFNRISKLIEDRQRELGDDDAPETDLEDDTIVFGSGAGSGNEGLAAAPDTFDDDGESVSLLGLRGQPSPLPTATLAPSIPTTPPADEAAPPVQPEDSHEPTRAESNHEADTLPYVAAPATAERPRPMAVPNIGASTSGASLVAGDATWEGKLRSDGDIRVEGIVRGEIDTAATLVVAPQARIHGTIRARNLLIGGDVEGDVTCEERLEILPGGSARGQINSGTLVVHEGAYIDSRFQMRRDSADTAH